MGSFVLDASALIAFLRNEPGGERVAAVVSAACISAVNLAETYAKFVRYGLAAESVVAQVDRLQLRVIPFDREQAHLAAALWPSTRAAGLSLGDRACLALAVREALPVLTTDAAWGSCNPGVEIVFIR